MLSHLSIKTKINAMLGISVVILSMYTIVWNFDMRTLYLKQDRVEVEYNKTMALNKQLLTEHSKKISGEAIKNKAINTLKMMPPRSIEQILL
ncbi:cell division protein FtsL [Candidatus Thioglobus sp.]|jgi:cell division protein FtsL|uniref:cell division protein FtsL n=1 Tax=Candidatus Thioglobus sp. TaxID=2026721 RepID=UPI001D3FFECA|nr:cell division protein FtsL [Candidatus Thioglobus sp.]MBT3187240.1 hypothetical protein [Candidatus Thioglobus sp.]MBT3431124.1 hypothetical protein [Candidatus Thioglobus sp.]MBT3965590.1 hypothetical protein [Candidatus Thioglobus sp.]MBT4315737.1 hypothetical protein [Candidatus Thioglobus sp.]MBT4923252.1 hypothetical protein [Candidatus Thioglobus sp.]